MWVINTTDACYQAHCVFYVPFTQLLNSTLSELTQLNTGIYDVGNITKTRNSFEKHFLDHMCSGVVD